MLDEVGPETWARWFAGAPVHTSPSPAGQPATPAPFVWDEERRSHLRAELDAIYAHLYGLTHEELDYIMDTFPIVRQKEKERWGEPGVSLSRTLSDEALVEVLQFMQSRLMVV